MTELAFQRWLLGSHTSFPRLTSANCRPTSPLDEAYNCIAWAVNDSDRWWWPDLMMQCFWPPDVPRSETIEAFVLAFSGLGYSDILQHIPSDYMPRIALYAHRGKPTHAARQLPDGWWASKLGKDIDIEHELHAVEGPVYGTVAVVLQKSA